MDRPVSPPPSPGHSPAASVAGSDHASEATSSSHYTDAEESLTPDISLRDRAVNVVIVIVKVIASPFVFVLGLAAGLIGGTLVGLYQWGIALCDHIAHFPRRVNIFCIPCSIFLGLACNMLVLVVNVVVGSCSGAGLGSWCSPRHMWLNDGFNSWYSEWFNKTHGILNSISANCG